MISAWLSKTMACSCSQRLYGGNGIRHYSLARGPILLNSTPALDTAVTACKAAGLAHDAWSHGLWEHGDTSRLGWLFYVRIQSTGSTEFGRILSAHLQESAPEAEVQGSDMPGKAFSHHILNRKPCLKSATQGYCDPRPAADGTCPLCGHERGCAAALFEHVQKISTRHAGPNKMACRAMYEAHVPYSTYLELSHRLAKGARHAFIVLLRDPVSRTASEVAHRLRARNNGQWEAHMPLRIRTVRPFASIDEVLACNGTSCLLANRMTCLLGAEDCSAQALVDQGTLRKALARLRSLPVVLLSEEFVESMLLVRWAFREALPRFDTFIMRKPSNRLSSLTSKQEAFIMGLNHLDIQLYRAALELFGCHLSRLRADKAFPYRFVHTGGGHYWLTREKKEPGIEPLP